MYIDRIQIDRSQLERDTEDSYVFELPALRSLETLALKKKVTFLVGENGTGKSTLLEAIAVAYGFNPEGGSRNFQFSTSKSYSELYRAIRFVKSAFPKDGFFLRAESFYNLATNLDELDAVRAPAPKLCSSYGGKSLHKQSHGESFFALLLNRFGGKGLYLLDEPEAALSPARQLTMLAQMNQLVKKDSQFIIATHSPILMAYPDAEILLLDETGIHQTAYEQTEHYQITKEFLNHPERMLRELLD